MAFDVQGALRAGHSEEDVAKYLAEKTGFDIEGARGAGYDTPAILDYTLNKLNANPPAPASLAPAPAVSQPPAAGGNNTRMQQLIAQANAENAEGSSGLFRQALDVPVQVAKGAATGTRFLADVFGADNPVSQQISGVEDYLDGLLSAQSKQDQQEVSRIMQEAEDKGLGDQIRAGLKAFTVAPLDFVSNAFGTSIPVLAAGVGSKLAGAAAGTAAKVATGVGVLTGVGITKDAAYTAVYDELLSSGVTETEAKAAAKEAQAYSGENLDSIALGGFLGGVASKFGLEATVFKAGVGSKLAAPAMAKTVASTSVKEAIPEGMQGGQEQLTRNVALQREGFDVPTTRGVATAATLEGTVGAPIGAAAGYRSARADARDEAAVQDLRKRLDGQAEEGQAKEGDLEIVGSNDLTDEETKKLLAAYGEYEDRAELLLMAKLDTEDEAENAGGIDAKKKYAAKHNITEEVLTERIAVVKVARGIMDKLGREEAQAQDAVEQAKAENATPAIVKASEDNLKFIRGKLGLAAKLDPKDTSSKLAKAADTEQVVEAYNNAKDSTTAFTSEERKTVDNLKAKKLRGKETEAAPFTEEEAASVFFKDAEITENPEMALREIAYELATDPEVTLAEMQGRRGTPDPTLLSAAIAEL